MPKRHEIDGLLDRMTRQARDDRSFREQAAKAWQKWGPHGAPEPLQRFIFVRYPLKAGATIYDVAGIAIDREETR